MSLEQIALSFDLELPATPVLTTSRCEVPGCGGRVQIRRTADPFEDLWACNRCPARGNVSWSREFGPRFREAAAGSRQAATA